MARQAQKCGSVTRWSQRVTQTSNALDLEEQVFTWTDPTRIARSLKRSAEASRRRKASPFQSAMSMLNFYVNRAGSGLPAKQKRVLTRAKAELRRLFGRSE
jgi:uncharacterized protein DUF3175